jgi:hypothetical protein
VLLLLLLLRTEDGDGERDATDELALHWRHIHNGGFVNEPGRSFVILLQNRKHESSLFAEE